MGIGAGAATAIAAVGAAAAVGGTAISYTASSNAAAAARDAANRSSEAQSQAFNARLAGERAQLAEQTNINTAAAQRFSENQALQQTQQMNALDARSAATKAMNDQQAITAEKGNQIVAQGTQSADAQHLADAQAQQAQAQQAQNVPIVAGVQATNPLGAAASSSAVTKQAMDERLAGAAARAKQYGDSQAVLSSYNAPIAVAGNAATTIGTNLMPAGVADQLVRTTAPALLGPSTLAYQQAGQYGDAVKTANQITREGLTGIANAREQNIIDLTNLNQQDTMNNIQSNLTRAQTQAAQLAALGSGISSLGNAGLSIAGSAGAFKGLFGPATPAATGTPSAAALLAAPSSGIGTANFTQTPIG